MASLVQRNQCAQFSSICIQVNRIQQTKSSDTRLVSVNFLALSFLCIVRNSLLQWRQSKQHDMTVIAFAFAKHVISTMKSIQNAENTKIVVESAKIWRRKKNRDTSLEFQGFYVNHTSVTNYFSVGRLREE